MQHLIYSMLSRLVHFLKGWVLQIHARFSRLAQRGVAILVDVVSGLAVESLMAMWHLEVVHRNWKLLANESDGESSCETASPEKSMYYRSPSVY